MDLKLYDLITRDMMANVMAMREELERTEKLLRERGPHHQHAKKWTERALRLPSKIEAYEAAIRRRDWERPDA